MLVLARKLNETIQIGDDVTITIVQIRSGRVRLGITAPADVRVRRQEIAVGSPLPLEFEIAVPVESAHRLPGRPQTVAFRATGLRATGLRAAALRVPAATPPAAPSL